MATYNRSTVLRYAIQSVLWQRFTDFELLVIGDACTDNSEAVTRTFSDPRVRWHNLPQNTGSQFGPNNAGIGLARGRYIAYLGHDDCWLPDHLERLVAKIEDSTVDLVYALALLPPPAGSNKLALTGIPPQGEYQRQQLIPPSSLLHRRDLTETIGLWRDHRTQVLPIDVELTTRAYDAGKTFARVPQITVIKFTSTWRKDSYRDPADDEQSRVCAAIANGDAAIHAYLLPYVVDLACRGILRQEPTVAPLVVLSPSVEAGELSSHNRRIRGLDRTPMAERMALWLAARLTSPARRRFRRFLRRVSNYFND